MRGFTGQSNNEYAICYCRLSSQPGHNAIHYALKYLSEAKFSKSMLQKEMFSGKKCIFIGKKALQFYNFLNTSSFFCIYFYKVNTPCPRRQIKAGLCRLRVQIAKACPAHHTVQCVYFAIRVRYITVIKKPAKMRNLLSSPVAGTVPLSSAQIHLFFPAFYRGL